MHKRACSLAIILSLLISAASADAANPCGVVPQTLILLDRSGSMGDSEPVNGQTKWKIAVNAVNSITATFAGGLDFGLMLFSHWPHIDKCSAPSINVAVGSNTAGQIASLLSNAYPAGDTPLSLALDQARAYLQGVKTSRPQYVILITDGKETCQHPTVNTPPGAAGKLLASGVKTYVVGFGAAVDPGSLSATATAGGTGSYYQADNPTALNTALKNIAAAISCCGDKKIDPGETCDTLIPAGQAGACPTSCNDGNPCTQDLLTGAGCQVGCSFYSVGMVNGDGCCPPGANSSTDSDCAQSCGNGVLESGEKCDTGIGAGLWGGCPQSCDDGNACTADALNGTGCSAECSYTNICPANPAVCGDGKVDAGEWCDTGLPGSCPQSCDDANPCTGDILQGSGCLAFCAHVPISQAISGDGCCPVGASASVDSDCSGTCGDGVIDGGESCDPGIVWGPGACKKAEECDDKDPCTKDLLTGSACNVICTQTLILQPPPGVKDGCCPKGFSSQQDADCPSLCDPDKPGSNCFNACQGVKCADGEYCQSGKCVLWPDPGEEGTGDFGPNEGGCDCRLIGAGRAAMVPLLVGLVALLLLLRRRRR